MSRVLLVDDESDLAELVRFNLEREGLDAETVATAKQALEAVRNRRFDLVVLDVMLPDVSGVELCRRLEADAATRAIPVVMVTARGDEADRVRLLEAGAEDYVTKPFRVRELVLRVPLAGARRRCSGAGRSKKSRASSSSAFASSRRAIAAMSTARRSRSRRSNSGCSLT